MFVLLVFAGRRVIHTVVLCVHFTLSTCFMQVPSHALECMPPGFVLPVWGPHMCLMEFLPQVVAKVQSELNSSTKTIGLKREVRCHSLELPPLVLKKEGDFNRVWCNQWGDDFSQMFILD